MELEGRIIQDLPLQSGTSARTGSTWQKKEYVLETGGNFPKKVCFGMFGERVNTMKFELGKWYSVSIDIESREFNGRWYTDVRAYAMREIPAPDAGFGQNYGAPDPMGAPAAAPQPAAFPGGQPVAPQPSAFPGGNGFPGADLGSGSNDDLPF